MWSGLKNRYYCQNACFLWGGKVGVGALEQEREMTPAHSRSL